MTASDFSSNEKLAQPLFHSDCGSDPLGRRCYRDRSQESSGWRNPSDSVSPLGRRMHPLRHQDLRGIELCNHTIYKCRRGNLTAIGIGLTAYSHPPYAVAIFGGWALLAGLLQLAVGILRRQRLGGQWAMILSGLQSTAAGVAFRARRSER